MSASVPPRNPDVHPITRAYAEHVNPAFVELLGTLGYGRVFVRADGCTLWDSQDRAYLDALAGFAANSLGHNPPAVVAGIKAALDAQLPVVMHVGPPAAQAELGEALAARIPALPMSLFSCSGSEAVEAAMKLARAATSRPSIVYCAAGFHGTGLGALSVMGFARWRKPFQPLLPECHAVPFGDLEALEASLKEHRVAGFLVEPIQAEGGVIMPPDGYLEEAAALCRKHGALFMVDEVQTGLGRSGKWMEIDHHDVVPDVLILGKGLGAGLLPISATMTTRDIHQRAYGTMWKFDLHGSTYGGSALACHAALATLRAMDDGQIVKQAHQRGLQLLGGLRDRLAGHPFVKEVRGRGLLVGVVLGATGKGLLQKALPGLVDEVSKQVLGQWLSLKLLERGVLCQPASQRWDVLKLTPPLTITEGQTAQLIDAVADVMNEYRKLRPLLTDVSKRIGAQALKGGPFG